MWYHIVQDVLVVLGVILSILSIYITILVRQDTFELTKMSDKDIYYTIRLYPTENTKEYKEYDKYIRLPLNLVVDDFKINNKTLDKVNYNSVFTHVKYFMVYDYEKSKNEYYYKVEKLDDKTEAKMRLEEKYNITVSETNYSLTPNKKYAYILIETETTNKSNLDLIFFSYHNKSDTANLDLEKNENGDIEVSHNKIDSDVEICKQYYISIWGEDKEGKEDLEFMFSVYEDLKEKLDKYN